MKLALVLSGGGMFGAWQAGAWKAIARRVDPTLVVGASVGSLNGYAIAAGLSPDQLCEFWMRPEIGRLGRLPETIRTLMERAPLRIEFAVVLTDLLRLKPKIVTNGDVTWKHLAASCAIPGLLPQRRIGGRIYTDGGLLNPLPVWAAVELGATHVVALHALPEVPSAILKPFVNGFRRLAGYHPPLPSGIQLITVMRGGPVGSPRDALFWRRDNVERWIERGACDATSALGSKNISFLNCFER